MIRYDAVPATIAVDTASLAGNRCAATVMATSHAMTLSPAAKVLMETVVDYCRRYH